MVTLIYYFTIIILFISTPIIHLSFGNTNSANMSWYFNPVIIWHLSKKFNNTNSSTLFFPSHSSASDLLSPQLGRRALPHHLDCAVVKGTSTAQLRRFRRDQPDILHFLSLSSPHYVPPSLFRTPRYSGNQVKESLSLSLSLSLISLLNSFIWIY